MPIVPCPHCGADIHDDATFCRQCGSSDADGWNTDTEGEEDDFDYDEFVEENFGESQTNTNIAAHWRFVSAVLLLLLAGVLWIWIQAILQAE